MSETKIESYVAERHKNMINKPLYSNIILVVGEDKKKIHAQKQLLAEFSPYYAAAFNEQWKQEKTDDQKQQILTHTDIDEDIMLLILEYIYVGTVSDIGGENVSKVYRAADFLQLDHLMEICVSKLNEGNALELFKVAFKLQQFSLVTKCLEIIKPLFPLLESRHLGSLSIEMLLHLVINSRGGSDSDVVLLDLVRKYGESFPGDNKLDDKSLRKIFDVLQELENLNFLFKLTKQEHYTIVAALQSVSQCEVITSKILVKFKYYLVEEIPVTPFLPKSGIFDFPGKFSFITRKLSEIINDSHNSSKTISWKLLFRASEHQFKARKFYEFCDDKGPTVTIVKANNRIAAAYNCDIWDGRATEVKGKYWKNRNGVIVAIEEDKFSKFSRKLEEKRGAISYFYGGPAFGDDLHLTDGCDQKDGSTGSSNLGVSYVGEGASPTRFFGAESFTVQEYEVYGIGMIANEEIWSV